MRRALEVAAALVGVLLMGTVFAILENWELAGERDDAVAIATMYADSAAFYRSMCSGPRQTDQQAERDSIVVQVARELGVSEMIALAISHVENPAGDSLAISHAGAVGLMQVMPPEALAARGDSAGAVSRAMLVRRLCGSATLFERECNVRVGLTIFRLFLTEHDGDLNLALRAYNGALPYPRAGDRYVRAVADRQRRLEGL